jgi:pilus assembly protein CpaC
MPFRTARLIAAAVLALLAAAPVATRPAVAADTVRLAAAHRSIEVSVGRPLMVETATPFKEIVVGDPTVADVSPLTDRSFIILGAKPGLTGIALFDEAKNPVGSADVEVSPHTDRLQAALSSRIPGAKIDVTSENGKVLLSGTVDDAASVAEASAIASQYAGENVVNTVDIENVQQVQLDVRFVEASRTAGRELGIQWTLNAGGQTGTVGFPGLPSLATPFGSIVGTLLGNGIQVDYLINALEQKGLARRLAEPTLVSMSGETASFLAGGEFPFPVATKDGIVVEFKKFGVGLDFTPVVGRGDVIHLEIKPEVSQIDQGLSIKVGDTFVPAITVRRATTKVELRDGQSFVIGGLLQSTNSVSQDKVPWIGDVPVLGALFRSQGFKKQETDLVIIVTPRLVRPMDPGQQIATPLDHTLPPNDLDLFVGGRAEVAAAGVLSYAGAQQPTEPQPGYILDLPEIR